MKYRYRVDYEMKDSGIEWIGKIPNRWNVSRIGQEFNVRNEKVSDKEFPPLSVTKQGILPQLENVAKTDNTDNRKKVCKGDFVINSRSDRKGSCGVSQYNGSVSLICNVLTVKRLDSQYVHNLFRNYYFSEEFYRWGSGIVDDLWSTNIEKMKKINIPIPSQDEARKIAKFLDEKTVQFDSLISKKEALIQKLEEAKKSLISEVVTGKVKVVKTDDGYELVERKKEEMKDSGVDWLGEIPEKWTIKPLYTTFYENKLKNKFELETNLLSLSYGKIIRKNINSNIGLLPESFSTYQIVNKGDIIFRLTDLQNDKKSLRVGLVQEKGIITSAYIGVKLLEGVSEYFYYLFHCYDLKKVYYNLGAGVRQSMSFSDLKRIPIIMPDNIEQLEIVQGLTYVVNNTNELIDLIKLQIEKLKEAKQSLISEAVTGKIEILD